MRVFLPFPLQFPLGPWRRLLAAALLGGAAIARAQVPVTEPMLDKTVHLDPLHVEDESLVGNEDLTGMDGPELERSEPPFSNDLVMAETADDKAIDDVGTELQAAVAIPPAEIAAGVSRVNLKGFPTPRQRNGFTQVGVSEILNTSGMESIQGPLTPVVGRAAPGGIQNFTTARPRGRTYGHFDFYAGSHGQRTAALEKSDVLKPKHLWYRLALGWNDRNGPEAYSYSRGHTLSGTLTWKINRAWSTMLQLDYDRRAANSSPGVLEYRPTLADKIAGPYYPLIYFNPYGPNAGFEKRATSVGVQAEGQIGRRVSVRAGVQGLARDFDEDRWTLGQYLLDAGKLGGTREPQHLEQPFRALTGQVDVTTRLYALGADHKLTASLESTYTTYERVQSALETADRDALPAAIRVFDPAAPDYDRPDYAPARYTRFITNRREVSDYTGLFLSERAAFLKGRLVVTGGFRQDLVGISIEDRRPGVTRPHVEDHVDQTSYHLGVNYVVVKSRLLAFANTSTAFEPSTRVDARTGRVQGNETTLGYEAGAKALFFEQRFSLIGMAFTYFNQNISRRNPLYDDPVLDANQTQPQLVAAGEERFTGAMIEGRARLTPQWNLSGRLTYNHAITTKSPDLPEEIGRPLSRFPALTWNLNTRYTFEEKTRWAGLSASAGFSYIGGFVASYETVNHAYLEYAGYPLVNAGLEYRWKTGEKRRREHILGVSLRNALDRNLYALLARPAAGRELAVSYALNF